MPLDLRATQIPLVLKENTVVNLMHNAGKRLGILKGSAVKSRWFHICGKVGVEEC